jgi:hypothetical protein
MQRYSSSGYYCDVCIDHLITFNVIGILASVSSVSAEDGSVLSVSFIFKYQGCNVDIFTVCYIIFKGGNR